MLLVITLFALAGFVHGAREAYHAQPNVLEWVIKNTRTDYFGELSWLNKYKDGDYSKGYKSLLHKYFPIDFWHHSNDVVFIALIAGTHLTKVWWYLIILYAIMAFTAMINYSLLRNKSKAEEK